MNFTSSTTISSLRFLLKVSIRMSCTLSLSKMVGSLRWRWRRTERLCVAKASWVTGEKLRKRWSTGARRDG